MNAAIQMSVSRIAGPSSRRINSLSSARLIGGVYHFADASPAATALSASGPMRL